MRKKQRDKAHDSFSNGNLEQKKNDGDSSRVFLLGFLVSGKKKRFDASLLILLLLFVLDSLIFSLFLSTFP